jgi:hypothetical protein
MNLGSAISAVRKEPYDGEIADLFRDAAAMSASCGTPRLPMSSLEGLKTRAIFFARSGCAQWPRRPHRRCGFFIDG